MGAHIRKEEGSWPNGEEDGDIEEKDVGNVEETGSFITMKKG